jgi:hypothetical protein
MDRYGATWFHKGYAGSGNVEPLLDSLSGRVAIVAGNARGVFEEVIQVKAENPVVFAANDVGMYLKQVDHMVTLHASKLPHWKAIRQDAFCHYPGNHDFKTHTHGSENADYDWFGLTPVMALSGMFAAQIAYLMGCYPVILCGCPNDDTPRFFESKALNGHAYVSVQEQIKQESAYKPEFKAAIRSVSGWTREFFGGI